MERSTLTNFESIMKTRTLSLGLALAALLAGISGSAKIGDYVTLAGKVGVVGHIEIGARSIVGGGSVVAKSLPEGSFVTGYPARPHKEWVEAQAAVNRLPKILKKLQRG